MVIEILSMGFGSVGFIMLVAHCAGATWRDKSPHYLEEDLKHPAVETLKEMEL